MTPTGYAHIELGEDGVPMIAGTRIKVAEIAAEHVAWLWDAPQIQRQHPHFSLGQIYSALAYYYDHKEELDREIGQRERAADAILANQGPSPLREKLKAAGLLP
jgi:uncharacterized protein (DUF433 family)